MANRKFTATEIRSFGKWAHKAIGSTVDADTLSRARKVNALADRGATEGERAAAANRLAAIAEKAGIETETLAAALR